MIIEILQSLISLIYIALLIALWFSPYELTIDEEEL